MKYFFFLFRTLILKRTNTVKKKKPRPSSPLKLKKKKPLHRYLAVNKNDELKQTRQTKVYVREIINFSNFWNFCLGNDKVKLDICKKKNQHIYISFVVRVMIFSYIEIWLYQNAGVKEKKYWIKCHRQFKKCSRISVHSSCWSMTRKIYALVF